MSGIELQGLDELLNKLEKMSKNVNKVENQALHAGADIVEKAQKDIVQREAYDSGDLRDALEKGTISTKKGIKVISIGIQKGDNSHVFYGKFINWGFIRRDTSKASLRTQSRNKRTVSEVVPGIHFMERSIEENKKQVMDVMKDTIKGAIDSAKR